MLHRRTRPWLFAVFPAVLVACDDGSRAPDVELSVLDLSPTSAVISARNLTDSRLTVSNCITVTVRNGERYEVPSDGACFAIGLPLLAGEVRRYPVELPPGSQAARGELTYTRDDDITSPTSVRSVVVQIR